MGKAKSNKRNIYVPENLPEIIEDTIRNGVNPETGGPYGVKSGAQYIIREYSPLFKRSEDEEFRPMKSGGIEIWWRREKRRLAGQKDYTPKPGKRTKKRPEDIVDLTADKMKKDQREDTIEWELNTLKEIKTLDQALEYADVDLEEWEVDRYITNSWGVTMKTDDGPIYRTNYQVKVWFKRKVYDARKWADELYEKVRALTFTDPPAIISSRSKSKGNMLELDLFDPHFGKYSNKSETDDEYSILIAKDRYQRAISDLVEKSSAYDIDEVLYIVGNDHFHIDNFRNSTTKGTPQDVDGRWWEVWTNGCDVPIQNIRMLRQIAKVRVLMVLSNHDWENVFKLGYFLHVLFEDDKRVSVDWSPKSRKYVEYGVNLIGFTHGNEEKPADLPMLLMTENQDILKGKRFKEFHIGHMHTEKKMTTKDSDERNGIVTRWMRSLSSADFWHYKNGYVGNIKGAESLIWNKDDGFVANFRTNL